MHNTSIRNTLASITAAVLTTSPLRADGGNRSETSLLIYSERDRVRATEAVFNLRRQLKGSATLDLVLTYDGLTGASPTGGSPSKRPATITRPSGGGRVVTAAGELPVDNGFGDTRFAADAEVSKPLSPSTTAAAGIHLSSEHDYKSLGFNVALARAFHQNRTTLTLSASLAADKIGPYGGVPAPLQDITIVEEDSFGRRLNRGSRHKNTYDIVVGLTRVLNPRTVVRMNYSASMADGYLTDPYKIISVVQPADSADPGEPVQHLFERRPGSRWGNAVFGQIRRKTGWGVGDASYRLFWDDWGITSHTVSFSWRVDLHRTGAFEPSVRWYRQSRAEFSRPFLVQGQPLPEFVSADSRLADFTGLTYGLHYDVPVSSSSRLIVATEFYTQRGDPSPPESFGPLLAFNLFPDLNALMLRIGLAHDF